MTEHGHFFQRVIPAIKVYARVAPKQKVGRMARFPKISFKFCSDILKRYFILLFTFLCYFGEVGIH